MKFIVFTFLSLLLSQIIQAQNNIDLEALPDVENIIVTRSSPGADTVLIALHGGPTHSLEEGMFNYFEDIPTISVVEMMQYHHLHPEIFADTTITIEQAVVFNDTTVAMVHKVVQHFRDNDKTVGLIGHSFGAFLTLEYLDDYGIDEVFKAIPMSGRLNINQELVDGLIMGFGGVFPDGETLIIIPEPADPEELVELRLLAAIGSNRFVDSLAMIDLTKMMFVYGTNDVLTGGLTQVEIERLESVKATILRIEGGGHTTNFEPEYMAQVLDFIRSDKSTVSVYDNLPIASAQLYPTIISHELTIVAEKKGVLKVFDMKGQEVLSKNIGAGNNRISFANFPKGMYLANYLSVDNEWKSQKLIVD